MGASGSAWIKPKKRRGLRSDAITNAPHPLTVRSGQRFYSLDRRQNTRVTIKVLRVLEDRAQVQREDVEARKSTLAISRLLATAPDGSGRHYRFVGYASRAGYATHVYVQDSGPAWTHIICPEWHPDLPIIVATGALPADLRAPGTWLACRADLGAAVPAHVGPHRFAAPQDGFVSLRPVPGTVFVDVPEVAPPAPIEHGPGCGDIVLFVRPDELLDTGRYITGHAPPISAGGRVYLSTGGSVRGWRALDSKRKFPNGMWLELGTAWHTVEVDAAPVAPRAGVQGGTHGLQLWTWRSWSRECETVVGVDE